MIKKIISGSIFILIGSFAVLGVASAQSIPTAPIWKTLGGYILPINSSNGLEVPALGGSGTRCVQTDNSGNLAKASAACGSGGGGSSSVGPLNTLQASDGAGGFIGTGTPQLTSGFFTATSTTATSTFQAGLFQNTTGTINNNAILEIRDTKSVTNPTWYGNEYGINVNLAPSWSGLYSGDSNQTLYGGKFFVNGTNGPGGGFSELGNTIGLYSDVKSWDTSIGHSSYGFYGRLENTQPLISLQNLFGLYLNLDGTTGSSYGTYITGEQNDYLSGNLGVGSTSPYAKLGVNGQAAADYFTGISDTPSTFKYASTSQTSADVVYSPKIIFGKDSNGNNEQIVSAGDRIRIEAEGQDAFIELNPLNGDVYTQCCDFTADGLMHGIVDGSDGSTFILNVPGGNIKHGTLTKTVSYTASVGDDIIFVNGLTKTITLPTAVGNIGHSFLVKLVTNSTSTVNTTSSQTIDGSLTYPLTELNKYVQVVSNGANWWVIGDNSSLLGASASAGYFTATSTTASALAYASTTAISSSNLVSGNCVQASTGGLLTTTGSACGSGGGGTYPFTPTTNYGATNQATTGIAWFQNGVNASSTSNLVNASTTQLSSNLLYLTGATNATVGLIDDSDYTYWGTASRNGSIRYQLNHDANGGEFQMRASHSIAFVPGDDQIYDGHVQMGYAGPSYTPWTIHDNGAADREIISMAISGGTNYQVGDVIAIQGGTSNGCSVTLGASQVSGGVIVNFSGGNAYHKLSGCGGNGVAGAGGYSVGATTASNAHGGTQATVSITEVADVRPSNKLNFDSKINVGGESQNLFSLSQHSEGDSATGIGKFIWGCWDGGFSGASWGDETANKGYGTPCLTLTSSSTLTAGLFIASSTSASTFPYASTTALSATTLCLTGDTCRTTWPTGAAYPFALTGNATSTLTQFNGGLTAYASTTIGNGLGNGGLTVNGTATTTTLCLTGDTCRTTWPTSGSGSYPFTLTGNATSTKTQFNGGLTSYASSTIGDGTTVGGLTVNGSATTTGNLQVGTGATTAFTVLPSNGFVGAGTSTPWRQLSVNGSSDLGTNAYAGYFTATTSTASSLPYASTTMVSATTASTTNLYVSGLGTPAGTIFAADSTGKVIATTSPVSSQWTTSGTKIYYMTGNVGIGTTTPPANLTMIAASSTVASDKYSGNVFIVGGKENTTEKVFYTIDQWGHQTFSGDLPTISNCSTGTISSDSNDVVGTVTFAIGQSSCDVTFAHAYPTGTKVHVFLNQDTGTPGSYSAENLSTSGFTIQGLSFDVFSYRVESSR